MAPVADDIDTIVYLAPELYDDVVSIPGPGVYSLALILGERLVVGRSVFGLVEKVFMWKYPTG
jgi:hypothetical protein